MSYREEIQDKLQRSDERTGERTKLWEEVSTAYEQGGVERVGLILAEKAESLKYEFEDAIKRLEEML